MLYKFKARNTGDVIMLEPNGRRVLEIIGKDPGPTGIILPEQMPAAVAALRAAVEQEARELAQAKAASERAEGREPTANEDRDTLHGEGVYLRQRVHTFIEMLLFCHQHGDTVVWGV